MRKLLFAFSIFLADSCTQNTEVSNKNVFNFKSFGEQISEENAMEPLGLNSKLAGYDSLKIKIRTKIIDVCQKKGCWMNVDLGNNEKMTVRFKDYGFFVPKDAAGKEVVFEGMAYHDTTSVEDLKHYAEDAGKSVEEIEKITQPEVAISFEATAVMIKN